MKQTYHQLSSTKTLEQLQTAKTGLTPGAVDERLQKYGQNVLREQKGTTLLQKFLSQFKDLMIIILMVAAVIAFFAGDASDAVIIFLVVILNAVFGVFSRSES